MGKKRKLINLGTTTFNQEKTKKQWEQKCKRNMGICLRGEGHTSSNLKDLLSIMMKKKKKKDFHQSTTP